MSAVLPAPVVADVPVRPFEPGRALLQALAPLPVVDLRLGRDGVVQGLLKPRQATAFVSISMNPAPRKKLRSMSPVSLTGRASDG